jgi:hypothetical protein
MSDTRNHHYVPQGYLRGFAEFPPAYPKKAKTFVSDLKQGKSFTTLVRNVAALRDFNRIEADDHHPNALETAFSHLESSAAAAIRRIAKTATFDGEDKIIVLNLIGLLATRNPRLRNNMADFQERVYKAMAQIVVGSRERWESVARRAEGARPPEERREINPDDYEKVKELIDSDEYNVVTHQNTHIRLELDTFETVLKTLLHRKWVLQVATPNAGDFVTCDHPVVLRNTRDIGGPYGRAAGHGMRNTMLLFPLTRKTALIGAFEGEDGVIPAGAGLIARTNSMIIDNATAQVYAYDDTFRYMKGGTFYAGKDLYKDPDTVLRTEDDD